MNVWRDEHEALLDALRADDTVPQLYRRLSDELLEPSREDALRLRAWALALAEDPGGRWAIEHRHAPGAWPRRWEEAVRRGFAPRTDHHNALLFGELFDRLTEREAWNAAGRAWTRGLEAWRRVAQSDYLDGLVSRLTQGSDVDSGSVVRELLAPRLEGLRELLERALRLDSDDRGPVDDELAHFAWRALGAATRLDSETDPTGMIATTREAAITARSGAIARIRTRFVRDAEAIPWADGSAESLAAPFHWLFQVCDVIEPRESLSTLAVKEAIDGAWTLRKIDRDEGEELRGLLDAAEPFADHLVTLFESGGAFGQGSRLADFIVFRGEVGETDERRKHFERALELSPGHRNASLLLSYEILVDVENTLTALSVYPSAVRKIPFMAAEVSSRVVKAWRGCDEAEAIYPYNSRLEEYRERVRAAASRLKVNLPGDEEG